jgi:hypothetical protein
MAKREPKPEKAEQAKPAKSPRKPKATMAKREAKGEKAEHRKPAKTSRKRTAAVESGSPEPSQDGKVVPAEAIQLLAYQKWEAAGKPSGDDMRFWLEAKAELEAGVK